MAIANALSLLNGLVEPPHRHRHEQHRKPRQYRDLRPQHHRTSPLEEDAAQHLQPDLLIVELLDEHNQPVKTGEPGEVTITTLGIEGMPLLRYKTGDICAAYHDKCGCGRNTLRLSPVIGRKKQMIKFKGTTLFAPALFDLLNGMEDVKDYVAEVYSNEIGTDEVLLHVCAARTNEETDHRIRAYLQAKLRVTPQIRYITEDDLRKIQFPETSRKPVKFIDRR